VIRDFHTLDGFLRRMTGEGPMSPMLRFARTERFHETAGNLSNRPKVYQMFVAPEGSLVLLTKRTLKNRSLFY